MEVACVKSMGSELSAPEHGFWYSPSTHFPVTIGNRYRVVGMSLYNHRLAYLIENDASRPDWLPVGLFTIVDPRLPSFWSFSIPEVASEMPEGSWGLQGLWGYRELTSSLDHYQGLIEQVPADIEVFAGVVRGDANEFKS